MPNQSTKFRLAIATALVAGGLFVSATVAANPALGVSIAPKSTVTVGIQKPAPVKPPQIIIHQPMGFNEKGTHADAMGGHALRHRIGPGYSIRHEIQRTAGY